MKTEYLRQDHAAMELHDVSLHGCHEFIRPSHTAQMAKQEIPLQGP